MQPKPLTLDDLQRIDFAKQGGLVPLVAQDARTGEVLMLGYSNAEAVERSLATGELWFWSRSRNALWKKGETSGNTLRVLSLHSDCDEDALLALVEPNGPTCHTGNRSCFGAPPVLPELADRIEARARGLEEGSSYTAKLLRDRNLRLKKLGEEAVELAVACTDGKTERVAEEAADLVYHLFVACRAAGVTVESVLQVLKERQHGSATSKP